MEQEALETQFIVGKFSLIRVSIASRLRVHTYPTMLFILTYFMTNAIYGQ